MLLSFTAPLAPVDFTVWLEQPKVASVDLKLAMLDPREASLDCTVLFNPKVASLD